MAKCQRNFFLHPFVIWNSHIHLNFELWHLTLPHLTAFLPSNATAEMVSIDLKERRFLLLAIFNHQITPRMELAAYRQVHRVWDLTWNGIEPLFPFRKRRDRIHEPPGVGIAHLFKDSFNGTVFENPSRIHHGYSVGFF